MTQISTYSKISAEDLHEKLEGEGDVVLIDTLPADYFLKAHLPGAKNACVFEVVFLENVGNITDNRASEIIVYGSSGQSMDAVTAAEKLIRAGYQNVTAMEGGIKKWAQLGYDLEGNQPETARPSDPVPVLKDHRYRVDLKQSTIQWTGRNPNTTHYGTVSLAGGEIVVEGGQITGTFEIDMTSIRNINLEEDPLQPVLVEHLMSDDFFFTTFFPQAVFTLDSATPIAGASQSEPNFDVKGVLELRGIKKDLGFAANAGEEPGGEARIEAHFDVDRTQWGIIYGSTRFFEKLGMHLVFDHISIQLRIVAY